MARSKPSPTNGSAPSTSVSPSPFPIQPIPADAADRDDVRVNTAALSELKNACDDALRRFLSRPDLFRQIHTHTDVRLALGWAGVVTAAATGLYGYYRDFEAAKPVVAAGVILYLVLTSLQALYAYFVECDVVFVGKRKTFDKRIVTERVTISSRTAPSTPTSPPAYTLSLDFFRSASGGRSLLGRANDVQARPYTAFFDERGEMDQTLFEAWVGEIVGRAMEKAG